MTQAETASQDNATVEPKATVPDVISRMRAAAELLGETYEAPDSDEGDAGTEASGEEPQQDATETDPLEAIDDDSFKAHPRVEKVLKDIEARTRESERQRQERERTAALQAQQQEEYRRRAAQVSNRDFAWGFEVLSQELAKAANEGVQMNPAAVRGVAGALTERALLNANETVAQVTTQALARQFPDYRVPNELAQRFATARARADVAGQMAVMVEVAALAAKDAAERAVSSATEAAKEEAQRALESEATARVNTEKAKQNKGPVAGATGKPAAVNSRSVLTDPTADPRERVRSFREIYGIDPD